MYRNITYKCDASTGWVGQINLFTWDDQGKPRLEQIPYESHLYFVPEGRYPTEEQNISPEFTSVTGKPLCYKSFNNVYERKRWIEKHPDVKLYDCWDPITGFLQDVYFKENEEMSFAKYPLKTYAFDIETTISEKFPDAEKPLDAITCLTVADVKTYQCYTWVLLAGNWRKNLTADDFQDKPKQQYFVFENERSMYVHFLKWFKNNRPDVITAWNGNKFDIPYMTNRIASILSLEDVIDAFSPVNIGYSKFVKATVKSLPYTTYIFEGLTILDYMELYRDKFVKGADVVDFKLETVCQTELGVGKLEYEGSMRDFYIGDFKRFVEYNTIDVIRLCDLERKLKLIELTRYLCNTSLIPYGKIIAAQPVVIGALALLMKKQGMLIMTDDRKDPELKVRPFEGAYVYAKTDHKSGVFCSFDLNSLYPSIIRSINISPETYVGKVHGYDTDIWTVTIGNKTKTMSKQDFIKKFKAKLNVAPNGALFLKQHIRKGMCAQFEEKFYNGRKKTKKQMIVLEKQAATILKQIKEKEPSFDEDDPTVDLNTEEKRHWHDLVTQANFYSISQLGQKLNLNSLYGLFSSKYSPICLVEAAEAITSAGRAIIVSSMDFLCSKMQRISKGQEKI